MRQDISGEALTALRIARSAGAFTGGTAPFNELGPTDYAAGMWYSQQMGTTPTLANAAAVLVNGTMVLTPFIPRFTHTFTGIGWFHSSAAETGNHLRLGIYDSTNGKPSGSPLVDSGSIATTAAITFRTATISLTLTQGHLYYEAANADASLTGQQWVFGSGQDAPWFVHGLVDPATSLATTVGSQGRIMGFTQAAAFGALPAIGTLVDNVLATVGVPNILLKG